jgi:hypothetical protein
VGDGRQPLQSVRFNLVYVGFDAGDLGELGRRQRSYPVLREEDRDCRRHHGNDEDANPSSAPDEVCDHAGNRGNTGRAIGYVKIRRGLPRRSESVDAPYLRRKHRQSETDQGHTENEKGRAREPKRICRMLGNTEQAKMIESQ